MDSRSVEAAAARQARRARASDVTRGTPDARATKDLFSAFYSSVYALIFLGFLM